MEEAAVQLEKLATDLRQDPNPANPDLAEIERALAQARDRLRRFR